MIRSRSKGTYVCVYGSICICIEREREKERESAREIYIYRLSEERLTDPSDLAHIPLHSLFSTAEALDDLRTKYMIFFDFFFMTFL